ncbi:hypothetical protein D3C73_893050 [compost metagenome]
MRHRAVAEAAHAIVEHLVRHLRRDLCRADVGTAGDHAGDVQHAVVARHIADGEAGYLHVTRVGVDHGVFGHHPGLQRGGDGQRLHRRTRLDQIGHRAVATRVRHRAVERVRVVGRQVDHGQDLAGSHVHDHHRAAGRLVGHQRVAQFLEGQVLDAAVDAEGQVLARLGGTQQIALDGLALAVADHPLAAGLATQPFVERQLQTFLAAVVDVGEAQHVRHRFTLRVEATELALCGHARNLQRDHALCLIRIDPATQVHEFLVRLLRQAAAQLVHRHAHRLCQLGDALGRTQQVLRVDPDRGDRRGHRQRLAVAVGDHAARGLDRQFAQVPRFALALVEVAVDDLHVGGTTDQ